MLNELELNFCVGKLKLSPGSHSYKFQCILPKSIPSSIEHKFGNVIYEVIVFVESLLWPNKVFKERFTIIKHVNLNVDVDQSVWVIHLKYQIKYFERNLNYVVFRAHPE